MELFTMSATELKRLGALERLAAGDLSQGQVALLLDLSVRQVKRLWRAFRREGPTALQSKRRGRPSNRRLPDDLLERALHLVREHYADCGPTFAAEKLAERHGIHLDHETLRRGLIAAELWHPKHKPKRSVHPPRERRPCFGELAQIDGSHHAWFEERGPKCTLYVDVDDATSALLSLHFAEQETTAGYFELVRQHALRHGLPLAFYSDRHSIFRVNGECTKSNGLTQFARALRELNIDLICANSPQAKGRVERANGTLQNRLVKEMRYRNISNIAAANAFLPEFITSYNQKFAKLPTSDYDAHQATPTLEQLDCILCMKYQRTVSKNLTIHFENCIYEILAPNMKHRLPHATVIVRHDRHGRLSIERNGQPLPHRIALLQHGPPTIDAKLLNKPRTPHIPPRNHPWKRFQPGFLKVPSGMRTPGT